MSKQIITGILFLIFLFTISFRQKHKKDYTIKEHFDKNCNCLVRQTFYPDGKLYTHEELDSLDFNWNGYNITFYENGDTASFSYFKDGRQEGISFNKYSNGNIQVSSRYRNGEMTDTTKLYAEDGRLEAEMIFLNNYSIVNHYSETGELFYGEKYTGDLVPQVLVYNQKLYEQFLFAQENRTGEQLFKQNCTSCHNPLKNATGPKIFGITKRRSEKWLRAWISNPAKLIYEKDPAAIAVYNKWGKTSMTAFPLPQKEMDKLISYLSTLK
jgi:antitoxin component YwqK of YwqJK toxin-antitoxin module